MKLLSAKFHLVDACYGAVQIIFACDLRGKPDAVQVKADAFTRTVANQSGRFKPCVTHCRELLRIASQMPAMPEDKPQPRR